MGQFEKKQKNGAIIWAPRVTNLGIIMILMSISVQIVKQKTKKAGNIRL
jgi:hypothetical protein